MITKQLGLDSRTDTLRTRPHPSKTQGVKNSIKDDKPAEHLTLKEQRLELSKVQPCSTQEAVVAASNRTQGYFLSGKNAIFDLGWGKDLNISPRLLLNLRSSCISLQSEPPCLVNCTLFFFLYEVVFVCVFGGGYTGVEPGPCER